MLANDVAGGAHVSSNPACSEFRSHFTSSSPPTPAPQRCADRPFVSLAFESRQYRILYTPEQEQ